MQFKRDKESGGRGGWITWTFDLPIIHGKGVLCKSRDGEGSTKLPVKSMLNDALLEMPWSCHGPSVFYKH